MTIKLFNPAGRFRAVWDLYLLFLTVAATVLTPLTIVFQLTLTPVLIFFDILVTVTFCADILVHFNSAFTERREVIAERRLISGRYFKSWFLRDLLAAIPFHAFYPGPFLALIRLLKLPGITKTLKRARKLSFINPALIRLIFMIFWILLAAHLIACGWIFIGGTGEYTTESSSNGTVYTEAFYWAVTTLTTIGYGDITPTVPVQFVYVIVVMLTGAAIYGFIIGNIASIISNIDIARSRFRKRLDSIDNFLKQRNIPGNLQKKIHDYYDYLWESHRGYDEAAVLSDLPDSLKTQVIIFLNQDIIEKVPLFKNASKEFIREVILNLKPVIYMPDDAIITYGEIGREMYFISRGEVDVIDETETITYATLSAGQFFGEIALLLSTPRTATVRARDYCDLYMLEKETFDRILERYPEFAGTVERQAKENRKKLKKILKNSANPSDQ